MAESSYAALSALGVPLTLEEYKTIFNGPLAELLTFLSQHLVGRQAAANVRTTLLLAQEAQAKSRLKQPATTRSRADKAVARLSAAKTSFEVFSKELEEIQKKTQTATTRLTTLQRELDTKRKTLLLLNVLKAKHQISVLRIEALTRDTKALKPPTPPQPLPTLPFPNSNTFITVPRTSHTRDKLADLHRLFLPPKPIHEPQERLKRAIARLLDTDVNHPDTKRVLEHCLEYLRNHSADTGDAGKRLDPRTLDAKAQSNRDKALKLQSLIDRYTALRLVCVDDLAKLSHKSTTALPALRQSLIEAAQAAKGHIDVLRKCIAVAAPDKPQEKFGSTSFASRIKEACGMHESATTATVLEHIERAIRQSHCREDLLRASTTALVIPPPPSLDIATLLATKAAHLRTTQAAHEREVDLLTRKAAKADAGLARAADVDAVIANWRKVVGVKSRD
ncbi:hypothetical protein R3P38DRAFT_3255463 [Favolaschia claudopus]|uniref:Uncharacterized protein n=1 Tax=Favolaschia claudopus TaxID=2862362 RepID=A0AAW0DLY7_9AGAR